ANRGGGLFRDQACFGKGLRGGKFDFQPLGELVGVAPNVAHLLARVAWYQCLLHKKQKKIARAVPGVSLFHDTADEEMCTARGFPNPVSENGMSRRGSERLAPGKRRDSTDKTLRKKEFEASTERHGSCTSQGCRLSTGWG